jgi:hypothetical protein
MRLSALFGHPSYQRNIRRSFSALALIALLQLPILLVISMARAVPTHTTYAESQTLTQLASASADSANTSFCS